MNKQTSRIQRAARLAASPLLVSSLVACAPASSDKGDVGASGSSTDRGGAMGAAGAMSGSAGTDGAGAPASAGGDAAGVGGRAGTGGSSTDTGGRAATGGTSSTAGGSGTAGRAGAGGSDTSGSCAASDWMPGDKKLTLTFGGMERTYEVHIPASYTGTAAVPLVMTIHGAHNTIALARSWSQMNPVSDQNGFIVVYPQGVDCWNAGFAINGCAAAPDDVGFLKAVVTEVESHTCIDRKHVYATGISNGSMMSQYLGCEASDVFAAVAGVSGGVQCKTTPRAVPLFYVHGTEDKTIPYSSAQPDVDGWVMRDGCSTTPTETYNMGSTKCVTYGGCHEGAEVVFCTVTGMGHCWPEDTKCGPGGGSMYAVTDFKASPMMWEFFKKHPMP